MHRIIIIGCPGSGKTTFSRILAEKTGLPLIHLDYYYHQKKYNYYENKAAWFEKVRELVKGKEWIIDGNYSSTFAERFAVADEVIWIDLPRRIVLYRLFKRRLQFHGKTRPDMPAEWREKISWEFLKFVWSFNKKYKQRIYDMMEKFPSTKVVTLRSPKEVEEYLSGV